MNGIVIDVSLPSIVCGVIKRSWIEDISKVLK